MTGTAVPEVPAPVVSFTYLTMGKLYLRSLTPEQRTAMASTIRQVPVSHWTLRLPSGTVIVDVHPDANTCQQALAASDAMFRDPVYRFRTETFAFADEHHAKLATAELDRARAKLASSPSQDPTTSGQLLGRLVSLNRLPRMPPAVHDAVFAEFSEHQFASVVQLVLATPDGTMLVDPYLAEESLMDDYVFVRTVLAPHGYDVVNEWFPFVDRAHERALDHLAFGLGMLDAPTS